MRDKDGLKFHTCPDCEEDRYEFTQDNTGYDVEVPCDLCKGSGDLYTTIEAKLLDAVDAAPFLSVRYTEAYEALEDKAQEIRSAAKAKRILDTTLLNARFLADALNRNKVI